MRAGEWELWSGHRMLSLQLLPPLWRGLLTPFPFSSMGSSLYRASGPARSLLQHRIPMGSCGVYKIHFPGDIIVLPVTAIFCKHLRSFKEPRVFWSSASETAVLPGGQLRHSHVRSSFRGITGRKTLSLSTCWLTSGCFVLLPISQNSPRPQLTGWVQSSKQILCF